MSFLRYPAYKDSGIAWLKSIPSHWAIVQLRHLADCLDGQRIPLNSAERSDRKGDVPYWGANSVQDHIDAHLFDEELVLLGEDGAPFFDKTKPVAFRSEGRIWPNNHIHVLRPRIKGDSAFLTYCLNATDFADYVDGSTRDKLTQSAMNRIAVTQPSEDERTAIVHFLDRETAKIDALVAEQEQLITLLKEKRQAVISHAVTKGLDPSVPMKDSGVEWLGAVPAHWDVIPLKHLVIESVAGPYGASLTKDMYSSEGYRVYGQQQVIADDFSVGDYFIPDDKYQEMRRYTVYANDVLVSVMGTIGKVAVVTSDAEPGIINPRLVRYRCGDQVQPRFLQRVLMSQKHQEHLLFEAKGTTMDGLNMQTLGRVPVPTPPLSEQAEILDFVARKIGELDPLLAEAEAAVSLLQERRSALISAAVTGQIDVRGLLEQTEKVLA